MKKDKKSYHLENYYVRKKTWFVNAIVASASKVLTRFVRKKNLWLFGCWQGKRYDDNSRYLFEYVSKNCPDIEAYWITKSETVYRRLVSKGIKVVIASSYKAFKIMLTAGVVFYTHGVDDISNIAFFYGAKLIDLNHGICGLKKLKYYSTNGIPYWNPYCFIRRIKRSIFDWYAFDYAMTTTEDAKEFYVKAFDLRGDNTEKIKLLGFPRNDCLISFNQTQSDDMQYILFLPTYRPYNNSIVEDFVSAVNQDDIYKLLNKNKVKILIKYHSVDNTSFQTECNSENIEFIGENSELSTQELMRMSSILITDYSSCCIDFAIKKQPIIIFAPDYSLYNEKNGIEQFWKDNIFPHSCLNTNELIIKMTENLNGKYTMEITDFLNSRFEIQDNTKSASERIVEFVRSF